MQQYYNPTDKKDVIQCMKDWKREGFKTSVSTRNITVKRETSKYNKYMKWHIGQVVDENMVSSDWTKTQPEAMRKLSAPCRPMPIGDTFSFHINEIVQPPGQ